MAVREWLYNGVWGGGRDMMGVMKHWLYRNVAFPKLLGVRGWKKADPESKFLPFQVCRGICLFWGLLIGLTGLSLGGCQSHAVPQEGYRMSVQAVVNGNTLEAIGVERIGGEGLPNWTGKRVKIRLVGIDAPDLGQRPWGEEARQFLGDQVGLGSNRSDQSRKSRNATNATDTTNEPANDRLVLISFDTQIEDAYDRVLGYVWTEEGLVNQAIVAEGHALARSYFPNVKYESVLANAQAEARLLGRGIWNPEQPLRETPAAFRQRKK